MYEVWPVETGQRNARLRKKMFFMLVTFLWTFRSESPNRYPLFSPVATGRLSEVRVGLACQVYYWITLSFIYSVINRTRRFGERESCV